MTADRPRDLTQRLAATVCNFGCGPLAWWTSAVALGCVLILPLFLVDIPPLADYPNHLAREFVLAFGAQDPVLSRIYAQHWGIIPNLAIDVVMPAMAQVMPLYLAGRLVLAVTLLLPVAGAAAYHRIVFGRPSLWPLASGLVAYNGLFLLGFMNFQISLGMALLGAAAWLAWRDRRPWLVSMLGALWAAAIFFAHVFGLLFLAAIIGGWEQARLLRLRRDGGAVAREAAIAALRLVPVFAPPLVLCLLAPIAASGGPLVWRIVPVRILQLTVPFMSYTVASGIGGGLAVLACLAVLARCHRFRLAPGAGWAMAGLLAAYFVCPFEADGTGFIAPRLPVMVGFLLFAAARPVRLPALARGAVALLLAAMFAVKMASVATAWYGHNQDLAALRQVIAPVPAGSRVLAVSVYRADNPAYWASMPASRDIPFLFLTDLHLPALLLIEHRAFWPFLFTARGKQPLELRPAYQHLDGLQQIPPDYQVLQHPLSPALLAQSPFLADWQHDFQYVLLLNAGGAGDLHRYLPSRLRLVRQSDVAALFKVVPAGSP